MDSPVQSPTHKGHNRSKSAGVLKSIVKPASRSASPKKRAAFAGEPNPSGLSERLQLFSGAKKDKSPSKTSAGNDQRSSIPNSPIRRTPSRTQKSPAFDPWTDENDTPLSPKESGILASGLGQFDGQPNKENAAPTKPVTTPSTEATFYTPIWAQFTSQPGAQLADLRAQGINSRTNTKEEIEKYAPKGYGSTIVQKDLPPTPTVELTSPLAPNRRSHHTRQGSAPSSISASPQKKSKVLAAVAKLQQGGRESPRESDEPVLEGSELDEAFEKILESRSIPEVRRRHMRSLDAKIKREFIKNHKPQDFVGQSQQGRGFFKSLKSSHQDKPTRGREAIDQAVDAEDAGSEKRSQSRSRTRTRTFSWGKRSRSNSRPRSMMSLKNLSSSSVHSLGSTAKNDEIELPNHSGSMVEPEEFVFYLKKQQALEKFEVGRLHKLRILLRNETIGWVASFIDLGGMVALVDLLKRVMKVEWREEHEDLLLHEALLCMKGLCTTGHALNKLDELSGTLFPELLDMLFDEERKGPAEFATRNVITTLLFAHLATATPARRLGRAQAVLLYLSDRKPSEDQQPAGFISQMHQNRPYRSWCREVSSVSKEVFWIFLHHLNAIEVVSTDQAGQNTSFYDRHFPKERPPVPAAPYVGGVEWEATNYLASHLDLMNGLIASMETQDDRNNLREELKASGFEKVMGEKLRLCKEKFYSAVHDGLRTWVTAGVEDGWDIQDVRIGPPKKADSPRKDDSPKKSQAPILDLPKFDIGVEGAAKDNGWL